jgi:hypothetical protein
MRVEHLNAEVLLFDLADFREDVFTPARALEKLRISTRSHIRSKKPPGSFELELELELILSQMAQKPMLRG